MCSTRESFFAAGSGITFSISRWVDLVRKAVALHSWLICGRPLVWSVCSWLIRMPSRRPGFTPRHSRRRPSSLRLIPASTRMQVRSVSSSVQLPELPDARIETRKPMRSLVRPLAVIFCGRRGCSQSLMAASIQIASTLVSSRRSASPEGIGQNQDCSAEQQGIEEIVQRFEVGGTGD